jgi:hypothetical protein
MSDDKLASKIKNAKLVLFQSLEEYVDLIARDSVARELSAREIAETATPQRRIYFIQGVDGGPIKIGVANDPQRRLSDLQRTSPVRLQILATEPGDLLEEAALHQKFKSDRMHGEWFNDTPALRDHIASLTSGSELRAVAS